MDIGAVSGVVGVFFYFVRLGSEVPFSVFGSFRRGEGGGPGSDRRRQEKQLGRT